MNPLALLNYAKAFASLAGALSVALLTVYTDNEILTVVSVASTALVTWAVPNDLLGRIAGDGGAVALDHPDDA